MGELFKFLLNGGNRKMTRWIGLFMVIVPLSYLFSKGFLLGSHFIGLQNWFHEIFSVLITLMLLLGVLLLVASLLKRNKQ
jgi:membrane protein YdbS with pleckstrin-like domain